MRKHNGKVNRWVSALSAALLSLSLLLCIPMQSEAAAMKNLSAARSKYGVTAARTITAKTPAAIQTALQTAGAKATASSPYIVYAPSGNYTMSSKLTVPSNVIFVAEDDAFFTPKTASGFTQFFMVKGSLYGGSYDGKGMAYYCLRLDNQSFSGKNGCIEGTTVKNSKRAGIIALGTKCRYGKVLNNTVTGCGNSGISALEGAWINIVSGNTCKNNTLAGINLGHANINVISGNTIIGNTGHGISTNSDGSGQGYCHIHQINGNTIKNNGYNGVYMDSYCYVDKKFYNNKIYNNLNNGIGIDDHGYVRGITKNVISGQASSGIRAYGKGAIAYIGSSNTISGSGANNITIDSGGRVNMVGSGNVIKDSKGNGISLKAGSVLRATGKNNKIQSNEGFGIRVDGKSTISIQNISFSGNGSFAVKVFSGSKATYANTNLSTAKGAANRIYFE